MDPKYPVNLNHKTMLRLIERSADIGEGWRQVSDALWDHVTENCHPDLVELDVVSKRVRFTPDGVVLMKYDLCRERI